MSLICLVQADLNEQQRERFFSSMNIRQVAMPQYAYLQVKKLFLELFAVSRTGVADPNITHRKQSPFYVIEEGEAEEGEHGFWVLDEETGEKGFTGLYTETGIWVLSAKGSYSKRRIYGMPFKKGKLKGYGKKGEKRSRPPSARGQRLWQERRKKVKTRLPPEVKNKGVAAWEDDQQDTAFWGKGKCKGKGKRARKEWKVMILSKECLLGRAKKGKGDAKKKEETIHFFTTSTSKCRTTSTIQCLTSPKKQEIAHAEESWDYDYNTYWTDDWSGYESYYGYEGGYSQGDWYTWSYFASAEELTESGDKHSESADVISEDGQTDHINRFCFRPFACSDFSDTNL